MLKYDDIRFDKIILCGSILPLDFNWAKLFARDQVAIVCNECGRKDPWPDWASRLVPGTGPSGSKGFDWFGAVVEDVVYDEFGHGEFLSRRHIEEHWMPFLRRHPNPLAVRHGSSIHSSGEFLAIFNDTNAIDVEVFGANYEAAYVSDDLALDWIRVNPDIYTFLIDRQSGKAAGYINAMPVDDSLYAGIRCGSVADNEVPASGIVALGRDQEIKVYLMSIAVSERHRQWGQGLWNQGYAQLIGGFLDKLIDYARHRAIRVTHLLATAWTDQGLQMCKSMGMAQVGNDKFGDAVYEVELSKVPADKKGGTACTSAPLGCLQQLGDLAGMQMRRLTGLASAFSRKRENLWAAYCLHFAYYNFCRIHQTPRVTPRNGIEPRRSCVWGLAEAVA